ncbi:hypothetical protein DSO57_1032596 [Entomophthora muscae]|nr:hypothetical protein DSO57_1032596 [Entomophthora muscae]
MTDILFVYCKLHSANSYRQGMHELLAPMVYVLEADALADPDLFPASDKGQVMKTTLDPRYIEHDSYTLFERLMRGAGPWFEAPGPDEAARLARAHRARKQTSIIRALNYPPKSSTPILSLCYRMYYTHLAACDPPLFGHLERLEIEPQLFGLRWFRLLFSREMPFSSALILWDGILNYNPDLDLVEFVALALLLFLRDQIVEQDYSSTLQCLMRPPKLHSPYTLLRQAAQLAAQPNASTGYQIALENYKFKGIHSVMLTPFPTEAAEKAPIKPSRGRTNSTGNMPITTVKSSPSSLGPKADIRPKPKPKAQAISLAQVAELDAQLITGLEQCIKWLKSEPDLKRQNATEGLQTVSAALKGRTAAIGGQPYNGDPHFGFLSSSLALVLDKEEPWEFVSRPENEVSRAPSAQALPLSAQIPDTGSKANPDLEASLNPKPNDLPPQNQVKQEDKSNAPLEKEKHDAIPSQVNETSTKRRSFSEPPVPANIPVKQEVVSSDGLIPPNTSDNHKEVPSKNSSSQTVSPTNSTKAKFDNKKLKQVREQYDWIFGSDQTKSQKAKPTKSISALTEKASSFASCDPLGSLSTEASAEDFLSTLRTPPRASHRKSPSLSSSQDMPSILRTLNPEPPQSLSSSFTARELLKPEGQSWSAPQSIGHSVSPILPPSSQNEFIEVMFATPKDGFEINKPLVPPSRPSDEFFSNPW